MKISSKYLFIILVIFSFSFGLIINNFFNTPDDIIADELSLDEQELTIRAINKAMPAVVSIQVYDYETNVVIELNGKAQNPVTSRILKGQGTGFLISDNGWILTNKHVLESAKTDKAEYVVILNDNRKYQAMIIGKDPFNDLAILRILGHGFPYLELDSNVRTPIGTTVMAIGNVLGKYQNSVTKGIVSGLGRSLVATDKYGDKVNLDNVIQTDAEINKGNSGGPLINLHGDVVGVNVAIDETGDSIGFAIPADDVRIVSDSIIKHGRIIRPWFGVRYIMLTPDISDKFGFSRNSGAILVTNEAGDKAVVPGAPGDKAGLKENDIIFAINDVVLDEINTLRSVIQRYRPGDKLTLKVQRGKQILTIYLTLEEYKG